MQGRGDLERREGERGKIGPEAFRSAEAPIRHWHPIYLATDVILDRPSDHPSRGRIVRTCAGGPIFHASEAGAAALRPGRPALRTLRAEGPGPYPLIKYVGSWETALKYLCHTRAYTVHRLAPISRRTPDYCAEAAASTRTKTLSVEGCAEPPAASSVT